MSASKTYNASFTYQYLTLHLTLSATENVSTNKSTLSYRMYLKKPTAGGAYNYTNTNQCKLVIGGTTIADTANWGTINITNWAAGTELTLYEGTRTISHNSDGTGSVSFSATFCQPNNTIGVNATISGVYKLDTIPRASSLSVSPSSAVVGDTITIAITRAVSTYTHTLRYKSASQSSYTQIATGVGTSYSWTVPQAAAEAIINGGSGTITIQCETYSGSTSLGSKTASFTLAVPSEWVPTISALTVADGNGYATTYGSFLQSLSTFAVSITAAASHGATISSYSTVISSLGTYSGASFTTAAVGASGNFTITTVATDSRGRTATANTTVVVASYASPAISGMVYRCDSTGVQEDMSGEYRRVISNVGWQDDITGNALSVVWRSKLSTAHSYGADISILNPSDTITSGFLIGENYDIQIEASDNFRTTTVQYRINNAEFPIDILYDTANGPGIAMGKAATTNRMLDVAWDLNVDGEIMQDGVPLCTRTVHDSGTGITHISYKFTNGLLVETINRLYTISSWSASGGIYYATVPSMNWGNTFLEKPFMTVSGGGVSGGTNGWAWAQYYSSLTTTATGPVYVGRGNNSSTGQIQVNYLAIGRWK